LRATGILKFKSLRILKKNTSAADAAMRSGTLAHGVFLFHFEVTEIKYLTTAISHQPSAIARYIVVEYWF
jgi:hypothetical protein